MLLIILMFSPIIVALVTIGMLVVLRRRALNLDGLGALMRDDPDLGIAAAAIRLRDWEPAVIRGVRRLDTSGRQVDVDRSWCAR